MKKRIVCIITAVLIMAAGICQAATYTLPEKMHNQLAIGSGLKGTFRITTEGEKFRTPFLTAVSDADFSLRGMSSGKDFHYYVFQADENDNQSAVTELYCKDGICYLRSDMVQGKILALPATDSLTESLLPARGGNPSIAPFLTKIIMLPEKEYEDKWKTSVSRYLNELEMWLADFTVQADVVKQENGTSALVFTYVIPMDKARTQMILLFSEMIVDPEVSALLDTVMTPEQKALYADGSLMYYYQESLDALDLTGEIKMNKRVSAMGEVISSRIELPLNEKATGYQLLTIESTGGQTIYSLSGQEKTIVLALPDAKEGENLDTRSIWFTYVSNSGEEGQPNLSVRIDIRKSTKEYNDEEEKSHLENKYVITVVQDDTYLPEGYDKARLTETEQIDGELNLHYSSKYSQNSATTLEITASIRQGDSSIAFEGKFKTAAPWLFMPFEVIDPIAIDPANPQDLVLYFADWVSNAPSMIHHSEAAAPEKTEEPAAAQPEAQGTEEPAAEPAGQEPAEPAEQEPAEPAGEQPGQEPAEQAEPGDGEAAEAEPLENAPEEQD